MASVASFKFCVKSSRDPRTNLRVRQRQDSAAGREVGEYLPGVPRLGRAATTQGPPGLRPVFRAWYLGTLHSRVFSTDSGIRSKSQGAFSKPLPDQVIQRAVFLHFPDGAIQFLPEPHVILTHPNSSTLV